MGVRGTSQQAGSQWCNLQLESAWTELRFKAVWAVRVSWSSWFTSNCELRRVGLYLKTVSLHCSSGGLIQYLGNTFPFLPSGGSKDSTFMFQQREELQLMFSSTKSIYCFLKYFALYICVKELDVIYYWDEESFVSLWLCICMHLPKLELVPQEQFHNQSNNYKPLIIYSIGR